MELSLIHIFNHIVELKYYKTVFSNRISKIYGVEITKKEYKGDKVTIETERISNLSKNEEKVNTILEEMCIRDRYKIWCCYNFKGNKWY